VSEIELIEVLSATWASYPVKEIAIGVSINGAHERFSNRPVPPLPASNCRLHRAHRVSTTWLIVCSRASCIEMNAFKPLGNQDHIYHPAPSQVKEKRESRQNLPPGSANPTSSVLHHE